MAEIQIDKKIQEIISILSHCKFSLENEKKLQSEIASKFEQSGISFDKEYFLDKKNIPDFFIDGIAIEIKIKGNAKHIYKQCERYCLFDSVKYLVLVTNRSMGFPSEINNKPCYVLKLGSSWL